MIILFGVILYLAVLAAFASFGRFLKECDAMMYDQIKNESFTNG